MHGLGPDSIALVQKAMQGFLGTLRMPADFESITQIIEGVHLPELWAAHGEFQLAIPELAALARERYDPGPYDMDALAALPPGTLGHEYATTMRARGLSAEDLARDLHALRGSSSDVDYLFARRIQTHDIHHLMTNFDTSVAGEVGMSTVYYFQIGNPVTPLFAAALFTHAIREPGWLAPLVEALEHGHRIGRVAANLVAVKWEEGWDRPVEEWRRELNLQPAPLISTHLLQARELDRTPALPG